METNIEIPWSISYGNEPYDKATGIIIDDEISKWLINNNIPYRYAVKLNTYIKGQKSSYWTREGWMLVFENKHDAMKFKLGYM